MHATSIHAITHACHFSTRNYTRMPLQSTRNHTRMPLHSTHTHMPHATHSTAHTHTHTHMPLHSTHTSICARMPRHSTHISICASACTLRLAIHTQAYVQYTHKHKCNACTLRLQFFWEAFPAGSGPTDRTTYMFAYLDAEPWRPSMLDIFEEYCEWLIGL